MLVLIGPSASGKTEVAKKLIMQYGMKKLITYTTRIPRPGEKDGVDYHFVSPEQFNAMKKAGEFIETTYYNHNYYGSRIKDVNINKVVVLDPNGLNLFNKTFGLKIVSIFLETPEDIRIKRMRRRGDSEEEIKRRIKNDSILFNRYNIHKLDRIVRNATVDLDILTADIYQYYQNNLALRTVKSDSKEDIL